MYAPQSMFPPDNADPRQLVKTMQIICVALMVAVVTFLGIVVYLRFGKGMPPGNGMPMMSYMAAGMAAIMIVGRVIAPMVITTGMLKQAISLRPIEDIRKLDLYGIYQTKMIVSQALLEGAAFFNLVAYMTEGQSWSLGIVAVLLAVMAVGFPTFEKVDGWADDQLRQLQLNPPR
jgi:hypothetical protein